MVVGKVPERGSWNVVGGRSPRAWYAVPRTESGLDAANLRRL